VRCHLAVRSGGNPLPLWDEGIWSGDEQWQQTLAPLSEELKSCDGFVVVSPEWHGMVPAGLKNFFLMWTAGGELAHKPALIVTVSTADGGSYPIAELRMSSYKNSRICYLPEHLIIRYVDTVFNDDPAQNKPDAQKYFEDRLAYCLAMLKEYALAFRQIRGSGKTTLETYTSGM
jgi:NAD(P)H-dependent FMN reductase